MALNGNNIIIMRDSTAIAGVKSQEIQTEAGTIEIASSSQQTWREYIAGRKGWGLTVGYLLLAAAGLDELLNVGTTYTLVIKNRAGTKSVSGSAILTTCRITATRGNLVQGSFQFQGTGSLT